MDSDLFDIIVIIMVVILMAMVLGYCSIGKNNMGMRIGYEKIDPFIIFKQPPEPDPD